MKLLLKHGLPIPQSTSTGQPSPLIILESEEAPEIDLSSPAQYAPEYVLNPLAIFRMARKDIADREKHLPEARARFGSSSNSTCSGPANSPRRAPGLAADGATASSGLDVPARPAALSPLPSFSSAAPSSPAPSMAFVGDGLALGGYGGGGLDGLGGASHDLQTCIPMMMDGMSAPADQTGFVDLPANFSAFPGCPPAQPVCSTGVSNVFTPLSAECVDPFQENMGHIMSWAV